MFRQKLFLVWVFVLLFVSSKAQQYNFEIYNTLNGLYSANITALHQSKDGYLWIGTQGGLIRYDGYEFKNYTLRNGLLGNLVNDIYESTDKQLLIATEKGLCVFKNEVFTSLFEGDCKTVLTDTQQNIWVIADGKLYRKNKDADLFQNISKEFSLPAPLYKMALYESTLYLGGASRLLAIQNDKYREIWRDDSLQVKVISIWADSKGQVIWGTNKHYIFQSVNGKIAPYTKINNPDLIDTRKIIHFEEQLYFLHHTHIAIVSDVVKSISDTQGLDKKTLTCFLFDREKNLWIGSSEGLIKLVNPHFLTYTHNLTKEIYSLAEDENGDLLMGGNHGVVTVRQNDTFKLKYPDPIVKRADILTILKDSQNRIWYGTGYEGIVCFKNEKSILLNKKNGLFDNTCLFLYEDKDKYIWAGSDVGISKIEFKDFQDYSIKTFTDANERIGYFSGNEDNFGTLWLGTDKGLRYVENDSILLYPDKHWELASISDIKKDSKGDFWIATKGDGIFKVQPQKDKTLKILKHLNENTGLASAYILSMEIDNQGNLWAGSYKGISCITEPNETTPLIFNYDYRDGFFSKSYLNIKLFKQAKNTIWVGTSIGTLSFHPDLIERNTTPPVTHIKSVLLFEGNEDINQYASKASQNKKLPLELVLPYDKNFVSFDFLAVSLTSPSKIKYKYKLEGWDNTWQTTNTRERIKYNQLSPGNYTFLLLACNNDGVWNTTPETYSFVINPPFWETYWFIAVMSVIGLLIIVAVVKFRERNITKRETEKNRINKIIAELEIRALRAQMNPHFIFNSLNSIQEAIVTENLDVAYTYLSKFSRLLRMVLNTSDKQLIALDTEIKILTLFLELESLRFDGQFKYIIHVDEEIDEEEIFIPSLLIQPIIENAIWHGLLHKEGAKLLNVDFSLGENETLLCSIEDNGIGRKQAQMLKNNQHKVTYESKGIGLILQQLDVIKKQTNKDAFLEIIDLDNEGVTGTKVLLKIPLT